MKKNLLYFALATVIVTTSCKKDDDKNDPAPTNQNEILSGDLTTRTLDASKKYLLQGNVFVRSGQKLTIPEGTVIFGDKRTKGTLVIDEGGQIEAIGTAEKPIVFTSEQEEGERDKGDWGGIVMLGRANCNQNRPAIEGVTPEVRFGTFQSEANNTESSGTLKFVRIEFAGIALSPNNETNSLTMGGVGSGTVIENVQVSYGGDDGFEWFGGTVNGKNLVSFGTWDDDFDCDFGWSGNVQYGLAIRDPFSADQSGSNAFECDNDAAGNNVTPYTSGVFSNITVLGPRMDTTNAISGNYQHAMHLRRRTAISLFNSVVTGFPTMFRLDGLSTQTQYENGVGAIEKTIIVGVAGRVRNPVTMYSGGSGNSNDTVRHFFQRAEKANMAFNTRVSATEASLKPDYAGMGLNENAFFSKYTKEAYPRTVNFAVTSGILSSGAVFTNAKVAGTFFDKVNHVGAFGSTNWTENWTNFQPVLQAY
jgi:hypothetical protein